MSGFRVSYKKKKNSIRDELVMSGWVEGGAETVLFRAKHFRPFDFWALINSQAKSINLKLCFGQNKKGDWKGRDQEGAVPGGAAVDKANYRIYSARRRWNTGDKRLQTEGSQRGIQRRLVATRMSAHSQLLPGPRAPPKQSSFCLEKPQEQGKR